MDQDTITKYTRRGIREPRPKTVNDEEITAMTLQGVFVLGMKIKELDPSFYTVHKSLNSRTHLFSKPSDCITVLRIWDLRTNAATVTAASIASPIVIMSADHGFSDNDIVIVHDVVGNTAANGTFKITLIDDDNFSLDGSTGNAAWTSGGKAFKDPSFTRTLDRIRPEMATLRDKTSYYLQGSNIVIDKRDYDDDIIIDYIKSPSAITDIPAEYHMGLVAFNVPMLATLPPPRDKNGVINPEFVSLSQSLKRHDRLLAEIKDEIDRSFEQAAENELMPEGIDYDDYT